LAYQREQRLAIRLIAAFATTMKVSAVIIETSDEDSTLAVAGYVGQLLNEGEVRMRAAHAGHSLSVVENGSHPR
jgi:hypothetical protein